MREEVNAVFDMGVLEPVRAHTKRPILTMMVYDVKRPGVDFDDAWAPVSRLESVRSFLAVAAAEKWIVHQVDVKTAFLNAELSEEIYVRLPEEVDDGNQVYRLRKALYGLKQASRA
ncbi:hypothetical protein CEUSTIGMA_g13228.t1 [Chlamydomonas eustigma]|uniref:Reverse transcriptase Ty1/copia-type domain-containing protein n=1 Tax=Chlamydomonas eustigma TaxID=1157962 RepID=A0A250XS18_9CHLO|nr:hypothetical protein CEUSTIGMA_g13228.t1 [Chlamydomonas eustigma]|eukprot:GAX85813.1 hypothetical protein CEUSTIGMA_g13228.t1 [Chlamydomonas eustigma]